MIHWGMFAGAILAVLLMLGYFLAPEKMKEIVGDLLIIFGWLVIFGFFCYFWATNQYLCVGEPNLGIRVFETIAIFGLIVFGAFRLRGDI